MFLCLILCIHLSFKATVLCDICVLYLLKKKYFYKSKKYQYVDDPDNDGSPSDNETNVEDLPAEDKYSHQYEN